MSCLTEKLIKAVKDYPILYDGEHKDYRDESKKEKIWEKMASELNENSEDLKEKWDYLIVTYGKYVEAMKSEENEQNNCKWLSSMEFLEPFILAENYKSEDDDDETKGDSDTDDSSDSSVWSESSDSQAKEAIFEALMSFTRKRKRKMRTLSSEEKEYRRSKKLSSKSIDMIFKGHAKLTKTFSPGRQAETKYKITKVMLEQEALHMNETLNK
ncbi:PREDICTED: uncharacterized protein LOC108558183 [Nicrophorus vespilloides]|uniref:Uncharacterized protein LOC108558183 n=1 Tax=Nicrophorus vespilloides TaxID=110193 RepID=A0ABM1M7F5_NICVS|nr:PREDICTED: uncharacterized protein LOC108558183 [Nicrophorus vespilloides]